MDRMQKALNTLNANPCTAWDAAIFPSFNEEQLEAARRAWHAAIYAAAIAMSSHSRKAWESHAQEDRAKQRMERFAQLRAADPQAEYDEIMLHIHDQEVESDEAEEGRRILAERGA